MEDTLSEEIVKAAREVFVEPKKTTDGKKFPLLVYKKLTLHCCWYNYNTYQILSADHEMSLTFLKSKT